MALLPALLLALVAGWAGTLPGAAAFPAGPIGQAAIVVAGGVAIHLRPRWEAPGPGVRWFLGLALVATLASAGLSPVPRAGRIGLLLLPALLYLPNLVRHCWSRDGARRIGLAAWALVVAGLSVAALLAQAADRSPRAAMPLGHHNLLAFVLVVALPVAGAALGEKGGFAKLAGGLALGSGALALVSTRSFLGAAGAVAALALIGWRSRRAGQFLLGIALLVAAALVPRAERMVDGEDSSLSARAVYWSAAWSGVRERPWVGWGPGSTPWTLATHERPVPGTNPPGEVVGEAHCWPLALAYEIGLPGALAALAFFAAFGVGRLRGLAGARAPALAAGGLAGVLGGAIVALGSAAFAVPALAVAWALAAGAALAGEGPGEQVTGGRSGGLAAGAYSILALALLVPTWLAWAHYDRALHSAERPTRQAELARAVELDPRFPLYRARWAWIAAAAPGERAEAARRAAEGAPGVAALWLRAGTLGSEAGAAWTAEALGRAMALDPLGPMAPFWLASSGLGSPGPCAARAIAADPRLAAAIVWKGREWVLERAAKRLEAWPGLEAGWRLAVAASVRRAAEIELAEDASLVDLGLTADADPALSFSLHAFRRSPWPIDLVRVPLARPRLAALREPAAANLPTSSASAFPAGECAPPSN